MKKALMILSISILSISGCGSIKSAMKKESANRKVPVKLNGTWDHKGYLGNKVVINNKDFSLTVFDRSGKQLRKFSGVINKSDKGKNFLAAQLTGMRQGGKNLDKLVQGKKMFKVIYYKDLTDSSVKLYIVNGMTSEKFLRDNDENSKIARKYNDFKKTGN